MVNNLSNGSLRTSVLRLYISKSRFVDLERCRALQKGSIGMDTNMRHQISEQYLSTPT